MNGPGESEDKTGGLQYKEVRGLSRGLALLRALNKMPSGLASTSELARVCDIHRTTTKRLLETLRAEGLLEVGERDGQYRLARDVRQLSDGYVDEDWITQVGTPMLTAAAPSLVWPCNLATIDGGTMVIRASTRRRSPLSHHHAILATRLPLLHTALGRAFLAALGADELRALLADLERRASAMGIAQQDLQDVPAMVTATRERGYATSADVADARFSAVAVPVHCGARLLGAVNLVFTKNSQGQAVIEDRYVVRLQKLASDIGTYSKPWLKD